MGIRPIRREELDVFTAFSEDAKCNEELRAYLMGLLDGGYARIEWCLVAEDAGAFVGRIIYSASLGVNTPGYIVFLDAPWTGDYLAVGAELLRQTLPLVCLPDVESIIYYLDTPTARARSPRQLAEVLEHVGFTLTLERLRFDWTDVQPLPPSSDRLVFRTLEDVGEEAFIHAVMRVSDESLDYWTQHGREQMGREEEAREHFHDEQRFQKRYEPSWWQLAYTPEGALVGLVMPAENNTLPNIGYIGVVPDYRGRGYVDDLLIQGTRTLRAAGATQIMANTDLANVPMANAFRRCGYAQTGERRVYTLSLTGVRSAG